MHSIQYPQTDQSCCGIPWFLQSHFVYIIFLDDSITRGQNFLASCTFPPVIRKDTTFLDFVSTAICNLINSFFFRIHFLLNTQNALINDNTDPLVLTRDSLSPLSDYIIIRIAMMSHLKYESTSPLFPSCRKKIHNIGSLLRLVSLVMKVAAYKSTLLLEHSQHRSLLVLLTSLWC
jgi:hypothetical protein